MKTSAPSIESLLAEVEELRRQLYEATETIEAIRTGQVDALVVSSGEEHQLYTLKTADHAYRAFIENMSEGAITLNTDGLILYANSQFAAMLGIPHTEVIGQSFTTFILHGNATHYDEMFKKCWKEEGYKTEIELSYNRRIIPVLLSVTILNLDGLTSLSIIVTDLTNQKRNQRQLELNNQQLEQANLSLEASNHDLQQFASVASHDLQEPLRKIQMFANIVKQKSLDNISVEDQKYLDKILKAAQRMRTLIVDVLNYSKLSAVKQEFLPIDLNIVLEEVLDDVELMVQEKGAIIKADHLPVIEANPGQIRQVFQNIISNALKFAKDGRIPKIYIAAKMLDEKQLDSPEVNHGSYCLLTIRDNGIGFNEKYAGHIFSLFERLHTKDKYEGSGIGLSITKKIIDKHNGLVEASSSEGEGTTFKILLPLSQTIKDGLNETQEDFAG